MLMDSFFVVTGLSAAVAYVLARVFKLKKSQRYAIPVFFSYYLHIHCTPSSRPEPALM